MSELTPYSWINKGLVKPKISKEHELENELIIVRSQLEWIWDILSGEEISDFAMSFPLVRQVWELKQNELKP